VQLAPSDNASLQRDSGQTADIGAFWAWTIQFSRGTEFNLSGSAPTVSVSNP